MATPSDEPRVTMTVKELVELHGSALATKLDDVAAEVRGVKKQVTGLETRVEALAAADRVAVALHARQAVEDARTDTAKWSRRDRTIAAIGVGSATMIGLANTFAFLIVGHHA